MTIPNRPRPHANPTASDTARRNLVDEHADAIGLRWAVAIRTSMRRQDRAIVGGFPGTLSEIRGHLDEFLRPILWEAHMSALTPVERDASARRAYAIARTDWLAHREQEAR